MARRRARKTSTQIIRAVPMRAPSAAPIIIRQTRSAPSHHKKRRGGRRRGGGGGYTQKAIMGAAVGGAVLGFIDKQFPTLPTVPLLGRKGTLAVIAYFAGKQLRSQIAFDVAKVAAGLAAYEFAQTGHVSGDDLAGLAAQV